MEQAEIFSLYFSDATVEMCQGEEHGHPAPIIKLRELRPNHVLDFIVAGVVRHDQIKVPVRLSQNGCYGPLRVVRPIVAKDVNG
jgi:hypothetical protein